MSSDNNFTIGIQPCHNFKPQEGSYPGISNIHSCYKCDSEVSFCLNCCKDHHLNGYGTCKKQPTKEENEEG